MGKRIQWSSTPIENDILQLTINCDQRTLILFNERTKETTKQINVDLQDKTQFPWCLFVVMANQGYRCRIIPNHQEQDQINDHHHHDKPSNH